MKPATTYDPRTSQYCCPVITEDDEPAGSPWSVAYCDIDAYDSGRMSVTVTEIVRPDGTERGLDTVDLEWIEDQCRDAISDASRDDNLIYRKRA